MLNQIMSSSIWQTIGVFIAIIVGIATLILWLRPIRTTKEKLIISGIVAALAAITLIFSGWAIYALTLAPNQGTLPTPGATHVPVFSSPASSASVTTTPTSNAAVAQAPSPTPTPTPTETPCPTAAASANASTPPVDAVVTAKGCSYPVTWVFGFVSGNGIGMTANSFMSYGSGQSLGYISQLGIAPTAPYSGVPRYAWLDQLGSGYAIVISDTVAQPTADQLSHAALFGGFTNWVGGTYLSPTYKLTSTTPQPGGAQGYQFNLVVAT